VLRPSSPLSAKASTRCPSLRSIPRRSTAGSPCGHPAHMTSRNPPRTGTSPSSPTQRSLTQQRVLPHHEGTASAASGPAFHEDTSPDGVPAAAPAHTPDPWRPMASGTRSGAAGISRHPPRSHSPIRFTPSINTTPKQHPQAPSQRTRSSNPVFSECRLQRSAIRCQRSDLSSDLGRLSSDQVPD
jgi:hypothetical protein